MVDISLDASVFKAFDADKPVKDQIGLYQRPDKSYVLKAKSAAKNDDILINKIEQVANILSSGKATPPKDLSHGNVSQVLRSYFTSVNNEISAHNKKIDKRVQPVREIPLIGSIGKRVIGKKLQTPEGFLKAYRGMQVALLQAHLPSSSSVNELVKWNHDRLRSLKADRDASTPTSQNRSLIEEELRATKEVFENRLLQAMPTLTYARSLVDGKRPAMKDLWNRVLEANSKESLAAAIEDCNQVVLTALTEAKWESGVPILSNLESKTKSKTADDLKQLKEIVVFLKNSITDRSDKKTVEQICQNCLFYAHSREDLPSAFKAAHICKELPGQFLSSDDRAVMKPISIKFGDADITISEREKELLTQYSDFFKALFEGVRWTHLSRQFFR